MTHTVATKDTQNKTQRERKRKKRELFGGVFGLLVLTVFSPFFSPKIKNSSYTPPPFSRADTVQFREREREREYKRDREEVFRTRRAISSHSSRA